MSKQYWITKYALTEGIFILKGAEITEGGYLSKREPMRHHFYGAKDFHDSEAKALARAEEMRKAKLASLAKAMKRIENLKFEIK